MPRPYQLVTSKLPGIALAATRLTELGVPITGYKKSNLLCHGLGNVAVKYSRLKWEKRNPVFEFYTTPLERKANSLECDLVLLVCDRGDSVGFYIFSARDEVFFKKDGKLKMKITYTVNGKPYDGTNSLTVWKMAAAKERFDRISELLESVDGRVKAILETG